MKRVIFILTILPLWSQAAVLAPKAGSGEFKFAATTSPGALMINGRGETPQGRLEITEAGGKWEVSGNLKMKLESFTTGSVPLRDTHMKERYLEASKYPESLLILIKQFLPKSGPGPFEGELVLHGVKHKVAGTAELKMDGGTPSVKASFPVMILDHGITQPSFAGITVANEVKVETSFELSPN